MPTHPLGAPVRPLRILAVGAHPDDIEIGAGALLCKALAAGHEVTFLVLTDDPAIGEIRRREAVDGAGKLGVPPSRVLFAGFADGRLRVDRTTVQRVRELLAGTRPDIVVTHTEADSHNDHVEAHRIAHAAVRDAAFLHFSVHVSSESSRFAPRVFVEVTRDRADGKRRALAAHTSQRTTIARRDLGEYETRMGALARLGRAEAFEVAFQSGSAHRTALALSESPFHRLWLPLIGDSHVTLLYPSALQPADASAAAPSSAELHLNIGRDRLRQSFIDGWSGTRLPLREVFANSGEAADALLDGGLVLVGSPGANVVVRDVYNKIPGIRWVVESGPGRTGQAHVYDRHNDRRLCPRPAGGGRHRDFGVISRVGHPAGDRGAMLYVGGATPFAIRAGLEFLADPGAFTEIGDLLAGEAAIELLFSVGRSLDDLRVVDHHARQPGPGPDPVEGSFSSAA
ncbi:PIG-L deacetylase family protein [Sphaerimonospora sp. CA-214678]|uniref:PIG-L deacetylase family protein n=1 Tax=Sphaerimonospora sp. CA-214678 TaxID=3240029 RepID=UPI003D91CF2B